MSRIILVPKGDIAWLEGTPLWRLQRDAHPERMLPDVVRPRNPDCTRIALLVACKAGNAIALSWFEASRPRVWELPAYPMHPQQYADLRRSLGLD